MERVRLQYTRLQRHFEHAVGTYDEVSLLDLSHSLRLWNEMAPELPRLHPPFASRRLFYTASPTKGLKRKLKNNQHVCAYFPPFINGGITTLASNGCAFRYSYDGPEQPLMSFGRLMFDDPRLTVYKMVAVNCERDDDLFAILGDSEVKKLSFEHWLKDECLRISTNQQGSLETFVITRECLIKRLANAYEASHSSRLMIRLIIDLTNRLSS